MVPYLIRERASPYAVNCIYSRGQIGRQLQDGVGRVRGLSKEMKCVMK
jgi:hypothetical protein